MTEASRWRFKPKMTLLRRIIGPPRLWSIYNDKGWHQIQTLPRFDIYLNDVPVRDCVSYDCWHGTAEVYERDDKGDLVVRDDELMMKWLTGRVTVRWKA